jgi:hypothetical protein
MGRETAISMKESELFKERITKNNAPSVLVKEFRCR